MSSNKMNQNNNKPKIVEDTPTMMSVPMMSAAAPAFPMMRAAPTTISKEQHAIREHSSVIQSEPKHQPQPWMVARPLAIPSYHKLERTCVIVPDVSSLVVSERVANCLRSESIAATFDNKEAVARAETSSCVKFAVRLWERKGKVVVEVQRMSGCCFLFTQTAKKVLRAAKYGESGKYTTTQTATTTQPLSIPRCVPQVPEDAWEECTTEGLELACQSLKSDSKIDAHLLAVESLVQLSAATKCRGFCARKILDSKCELFSAILSLIQCSRLSLEDEEESFTEIDREHFRLMHRHAMSILANCLSAVPIDLTELPELTDDVTLQALAKDMSHASSKPHEAAAACRVLNFLCKDSNVKQQVLRLGVDAHISTAAQCRHALLEKECTELLRNL